VSYLRGFLPWIVFAVVSNFAWQWAALLALATGVFFVVRGRRAGVTADAQILDFGSITYFGLLAAVAFADPNSPLQNYDNGLPSIWLALTAGLGLLVGRPFILGMAKRRAAPEVSATAVFRRTCTVLTAVWASSFAVTGIVTLGCDAMNAGEPAVVIVQVLGVAVPANYTRNYLKKVRGRAARPLPAVDR
jgi:hypothetical protein